VVRITDVSNGNFVELAPVRYQFERAGGDTYEDNWLIIRGEVTSTTESWGFSDPCLLTSEAEGMGDWLRSAALGPEGLLQPEEDDETVPSFNTLDPNIGLGVVAVEGDSVTIRFFLWLEATPPSRADDAQMDYFLDLVTTPDALSRAAAEWDEECALFPER